jgi:hypothetical protein
MPQTFKDSLRGCYEIPLFLTRGVERFENSKAAFLQSLLIPLFLIPLQIPIAKLDPALSAFPPLSLFVIVSYRTIVGAAFFLGIVWLLCWPLERRGHFFRFATSYNWLGIPAYILLLPYAILVGTGAFSVEQMGGYLLFLIGLLYTFIAFTAKVALNTSWAMAAGIGAAALLTELVAISLL